jgi:4-amino-4-deoxy-L-arabinose transferase-like glycosyltransferase
VTADLTPFGGRSDRHRRYAVALIVGATVIRLAYLFFFCPYDLAPDEAHYWDWSRHLDWSYYSKGPLIAWIIRAGCELFGPAALATDGTLMPAVRAPAVLCGAGLLAALYVLTWQTYRSDRLAFWVVAAGLSLPAFAACSLIMTIDAPFLCCWAWALVFGRWAMVDGKPWAWVPAGLLVALGVLAKQTMALWLFSTGLFVLFTPTHRRLLAHWGFWVMGAVAGLSALPILYWNGQHDWVTFRHVAVQAGVTETHKSSGLRWLGPFEYAGGQFALLLGYWFVVWAMALVRYRPRAGVSVGVRYLWWMSVPTFAVFAASSLLKSGQINWPVSAYLSGGVLAAGWLAGFLSRTAARWPRRALATALVLGFAFTLFAHNTRLVTAVLAPFAPAPTPENPMPVRMFDPAARLKGWRQLGGELDAIRANVRAEDGADPVLAGLRWDVPGLLSIYTDGHPQGYSLGLVLRYDRHSQYDLWHPNPADDAQAFRGRTFVVVAPGDARAALAPAFESVGAPQDVVYRENGRPLAVWSVIVCRGYRGVAPEARSIEAGH